MSEPGPKQPPVELVGGDDGRRAQADKTLDDLDAGQGAQAQAGPGPGLAERAVKHASARQAEMRGEVGRRQAVDARDGEMRLERIAQGPAMTAAGEAEAVSETGAKPRQQGHVAAVLEHDQSLAGDRKAERPATHAPQAATARRSTLFTMAASILTYIRMISLVTRLFNEKILLQ